MQSLSEFLDKQGSGSDLSEAHSQSKLIRLKQELTQILKRIHKTKDHSEKLDLLASQNAILAEMIMATYDKVQQRG